MQLPRKGSKVLVLDRPNPIGGKSFYGPMRDDGKESFVAFHNLPIRHGLTIGELAKLFLLERKMSDGNALGCKLEVVAMENWNRADLFDASGLEWVYPSPNLRTLAAALLYQVSGYWKSRTSALVEVPIGPSNGLVHLG